MKAKKDLQPDKEINDFDLKPPLEGVWYCAFFLEKFSKIKSPSIKNNKQNDNLFARARSSKEMKAQTDMAKQQLETEKLQFNVQKEQQELQLKAQQQQLDAERQMLDIETERAKLEADIQIREQELAIKEQKNVNTASNDEMKSMINAVDKLAQASQGNV